MISVIYSILPIFFIILLGRIIKFQWITSREFWRGLEKISYYILFPAVLFNYISTADLACGYLSKLIISLIAASSIIGLVLFFLRNELGIDSKNFTSVFQGSVRYNSYIFFALGSSLYGTEGLVIISVIASYMIIYTNVVTVLVFGYFLENENNKKIENLNQNNKFITLNEIYLAQSRINLILKNLLTNPLIIASVLGFVSNQLHLKPAPFIIKFLTNLSDSALAMGLLCVGSSLKFLIDTEKFKIIFISCITKLIIFPIITFLILTILGVTGLPKSIGILYACLPTASNSYILSRQMGGDSDTMASILTFTIIFSLISLTILTYILA